MEVSKTFFFDAAHHLTDYYGKCENPHGHTYILTVTVSGPVQKNGLVCDFHLLKEVVKEEILEHLDHHDLNEIFKNPSAELIAMWIWKKLKPAGKLLQRKARGKMNFSNVQLAEIRLCETPNSCVSYRGK